MRMKTEKTFNLFLNLAEAITLSELLGDYEDYRDESDPGRVDDCLELARGIKQIIDDEI